MVLISIFFLHESDPRRIINRLFFIHFVRSCACSSSSGWNITSNLSVWRFEHVNLTYICRLYFPPFCRTTLCYATNTISENIPNIWHKSSAKHKEVRPDWNDKNDNANYAPSYHMESFTNGSGCHFKENIRSSAKRFRLWIVLFWTKTSDNLTLYLLSSHNR